MPLIEEGDWGRLYHGDCREVIATFPDNSVDAVVTDPPAGIGFMGKEWDDFRRARNPADAGRDDVFGRTSARGPEYGRRDRVAFVEFLRGIMVECLRVTRPGHRALVWAIPRTSHWTATAIEDAGWEIEDRVSHLHAQGFPKHASKLKPSCEDWWLARKPASRVLPLNVDACRVEGRVDPVRDGRMSPGRRKPGGARVYGEYSGTWDGPELQHPASVRHHAGGRWPANVVLTCCGNDPHDDDCPVLMLDLQSGERPSAPHGPGIVAVGMFGVKAGHRGYDDSGTASRFFYCPKASKADRGEGNGHPTVKNTGLCEWLVRLITPPGGVVLDPFMGSGSIGVACVRQGFKYTGIEREAEYVAIARRRIARELAERPLFPDSD